MVSRLLVLPGLLAALVVLGCPSAPEPEPEPEEPTAAVAGRTTHETDATGEVAFNSTLLDGEVGVRVAGPDGLPVEGCDVSFFEHIDPDSNLPLLHIVVTDPLDRYVPAVLYGSFDYLTTTEERDVVALLEVLLGFKSAIDVAEGVGAVWEAYSEFRSDQVVLPSGEKVNCATTREFIDVVRAEAGPGFHLISFFVTGPFGALVHVGGWVISEFSNAEELFIDMVEADARTRLTEELGQEVGPDDLLQFRLLDWRERLETEEWSSVYVITLDDGTCGGSGDDDDETGDDDDDEGWICPPLAVSAEADLVAIGDAVVGDELALSEDLAGVVTSTIDPDVARNHDPLLTGIVAA